MGGPLIRPLDRRWREDPTRCACPLAWSPCDGAIDGEDRLCSFCREHHRPDYPQSFEEDEDA